VWLEVDAAPGKRFRGRVGFISPQAEFTPKTVETREIRDDLVFRFRVAAEDPDNLMRQGMPVTVIVPLRSESGSGQSDERP
jgi:HlyD family secretion protein